MVINLPEELLLEIFIRVPVLSLLRFRCVSKFWYSLISSSNFIDSHLQHNHNHTQLCGDDHNVLFKKILANPKEEIYSLHSDNPKFHEIETYYFPFHDFIILGCVNGLVCLIKTKNNNSQIVILWIPCIRKCFIISESHKQSIKSDVRFGFGYDDLSNDFKVVRFEDNRELDNAKALVTVFSLAAKSWKIIENCTCLRWLSVECNGGRFLYGTGIIPGMYSEPRVACFDLGVEIVTDIVFSNDDKLDNNNGRALTIFTSFRNSFGMLHGLLDGWEVKEYEMWVLKEEEDGVGMKSWRKLFSVQFDEGDFRNHGIVGFTMKELLIVVGDVNVVVSIIEEDVQVVKYVRPCSSISSSTRVVASVSVQSEFSFIE